MSGLRRLQLDFQSFVCRGGNGFRPAIVGDERADPAERLDVYYQAYRLRLLEIVRQDFTGLVSLMDEQTFRDLFIAYLDAYPSTDPSVRWFGRGLADFLADTQPYAGRPELSEMARFEWAWGLAFDGPDAPVTDISALERLPGESWGGLRFALQPSVQRLALASNVPAILDAVTKGQVLPKVEIKPQPAEWLMWRRKLEVFWRPVDVDEAWALDACGAGRDFAQLCAGLCRWHVDAQVPVRMAVLLKRWVSDGLIAEIRTGS